MTSAATNTSSTEQQQHVEGDAQKDGSLLEGRVSRIADAEDRDRHGQRRQDDEKPGGEWIDRIVQREARCVMNEEHPPRRSAGTERGGGREARDRRGEGGTAERNSANKFAAPAQQQSDDDHCDADGDDGANTQRRAQRDHRSPLAPASDTGTPDMQRM